MFMFRWIRLSLLFWFNGWGSLRAYSLVLKTNGVLLTTCFQGSQTCSASSDMVIDKIGCTMLYSCTCQAVWLVWTVAMFEVPTLKSHQTFCFLWCFCWWSQPHMICLKTSCQPRHGSKKGWTGEHSKFIETTVVTPLWFWGFWGSLAPHLIGKCIIPGDHCRSPNITGFLFVLHLFLHHHEQKRRPLYRNSQFPVAELAGPNGMLLPWTCDLSDNILGEPSALLWPLKCPQFCDVLWRIIILGEVEKCSATWVLSEIKEDSPYDLLRRWRHLMSL